MAETDVKINLEDLNAKRPAAADFNKLKTELAKELYRRSGNGSVYGQYVTVRDIPDLGAGQKATADQ